MRSLVITAMLLAGSSTATLAQGNAEAGEEVFRKCRACHDVGGTARNKIGPLLNGIIGRRAGSVDGFAYSDANKEAGAKGLVWSQVEFAKYITDPAAYMPKNKMAFAGLKDEQDRKDLIAFLLKFPQ